MTDTIATYGTKKVLVVASEGPSLGSEQERSTSSARPMGRISR